MLIVLMLCQRQEKLYLNPTVRIRRCCLPPSLEELIERAHPVRVVSEIIESIDLSKLGKATKEQNIHFMWLAGMQRPDHNTINSFRGKRLQDTLKEVFTQKK